MRRKNIFEGDSYYTLFVHAIYKRVVGGEWFSYADVMTDFCAASPRVVAAGVSKCDNYGELKKAFRDVRRIIKEQEGEACFEETGNNRHKRFRYVGATPDPLAGLRQAKVINDVKEYWQFCQDSAGFFPTAWLEHFLGDSLDLFQISSKRRKGEQVLSSSLNRMLTNIELLPSLYMAIMKQRVLKIDYKPYEEKQRTFIFHPHYLKEYNGRWHLYGHAQGLLPKLGYNLALDRIVGIPREVSAADGAGSTESYMAAPKGFYEELFRHIIGVTHFEDARVETIRVRAHSKKMFMLMETKQLHPTQATVVAFGQHVDGEYGEFSVEVEVNNELIGSILQKGAGLEIVAPEHVRAVFRQKVEKLAALYR